MVRVTVRFNWLQLITQRRARAWFSWREDVYLGSVHKRITVDVEFHPTNPAVLIGKAEATQLTHHHNIDSKIKKGARDVKWSLPLTGHLRDYVGGFSVADQQPLLERSDLKELELEIRFDWPTDN